MRGSRHVSKGSALNDSRDDEEEDEVGEHRSRRRSPLEKVEEVGLLTNE